MRRPPRYGQLQDPFGHRWSVATHIRDSDPAEWPEAMKQMGNTQPRKDPNS
jgi:hypothetical protein